MASFQTRLSGKASERRYRFHCSNFLQPLFFENLFLNLKTIKGDLLLVCRSDRRGSRSESCEINIYLIVFQHLWMNFVIADSKCRYFGLHQVWVCRGPWTLGFCKTYRLRRAQWLGPICMFFLYLQSKYLCPNPRNAKCERDLGVQTSPDILLEN